MKSGKFRPDRSAAVVGTASEPAPGHPLGRDSNFLSWRMLFVGELVSTSPAYALDIAHRDVIPGRGRGRASDERGQLGAVLAARSSPGAAGARTVASLGMVARRHTDPLCQPDRRGDFGRRDTRSARGVWLRGQRCGAQITRLATTLPDDNASRFERLRGFGAGLERTLTCRCTRARLSDGTDAILIAATEQAGPELSLAERVAYLLAGTEAPVAAFAPDGTLIEATAAANAHLAGARTLAALGAGALAAEPIAMPRATQSQAGSRSIGSGPFCSQPSGRGPRPRGAASRCGSSGRSMPTDASRSTRRNSRR